jgi:ribosome-binding factor A
MKRTPTLAFVYDGSVDTGMRISKLLADVAPGEANEG